MTNSLFNFCTFDAMHSHTVYCSLGGNQGDRRGFLKNTINLLQEAGCEIVALSSVYETKAWGLTDQPDFLNMCVALKTTLNPHECLSLFIATERKLGRVREMKWGPRTIDIDILLFDDLVVSDEQLIIPHPYMQDRKFVLAPLTEIANEIIHPVLLKTIGVLNEQSSDIGIPLNIGELQDSSNNL